MKYNKVLINQVFDIKEQLNEKDKRILEQLIKEYNLLYVNYRQAVNESLNDVNIIKRLEDENKKLKNKLDKTKKEIVNENTKRRLPKIEVLSKEVHI